MFQVLFVQKSGSFVAKTSKPSKNPKNVKKRRKTAILGTFSKSTDPRAGAKSKNAKNAILDPNFARAYMGGFRGLGPYFLGRRGKTSDPILDPFFRLFGDFGPCLVVFDKRLALLDAFDLSRTSVYVSSNLVSLACQNPCSQRP